MTLKEAGTHERSRSSPPEPLSAPLPVPVDYPAALAQRKMAAHQCNCPTDLLAPEVSSLHHFWRDLYSQMLFTTLWNTGAQINDEAKRRSYLVR
ncbi:hypothetical protein [Erwinia psidii]|uniref:Uncharacterized protein n=1 Tax=Erwinia psidii TaxID=69224 RepID=A0A3N6S255_9GAMM|nr:hypothetical protein [Erwinia psidii]MCX8957469.1 hypothetical protein [Erwinia psidii]MCX8960522.1 hypothetical protein [Erwinia psidii]MCX8964233.1 hypothetical protein [Erwinia psidii]RQM39708.1 hypothetical protein EB241_04605 [Erwinia psidii]